MKRSKQSSLSPNKSSKDITADSAHRQAQQGQDEDELVARVEAPSSSHKKSKPTPVTASTDSSTHAGSIGTDDSLLGVVPPAAARMPSVTAKSFTSSTGNPKQTMPPAIAAAAKAPATYDSPAATKGGPRIRLPDKLMEYLNNRVEQDVLWWQPDGDGFAFDSSKVQSHFLDKHFEKTKLKSFIRSLNRWGFRRIFYNTLPKTVFSFHHPLFKKDSPELARQIKMLSYSGQQAADMEEYNRLQREGAVTLPGTSSEPTPSIAALAPRPVVGNMETGSMGMGAHQASASEPASVSQSLPSTQQQAWSSPASAEVQHEIFQSLLSNPLYSNQVLRNLQEEQVLQQRREELQVHMGQEQHQQQLLHQNFTQKRLIQSMLAMTQQQDQQQQISLPVAGINNTENMLLSFRQRQVQQQGQALPQQTQSTALLQYLNSQQRMDNASTALSSAGGEQPSQAVSSTTSEDAKEGDKKERSHH